LSNTRGFVRGKPLLFQNLTQVCKMPESKDNGFVELVACELV
jgi:hypothetical protein